MANEDVVRLRGVPKEFKDDRGGAATIPSAVIGIVKNNVDPTHSGRLEVYLKRMGSSDADKPSAWTTVKYLSPFFGYTPNTGNPDGHGDYVGNPNSYGFWATPPDIGTEVVCVFLNGDASEGYYIGCVPRPGQTQMVPGIGAVDNIIANSGEAKSYGGATKLPVGESNNANPKQSNATDQSVQPRPIHSYQAAIYNKQGLLRDPDRGPITSSSMRESPSRVFGISTPGRPIYEGGFTDETIKSAASSSSSSNKSFQIVGRTGGHTLVMDDGDLTGKDQLTRLRTSSGHTILMNDSAQTLFIIHANGQSYIELGKEGTIDMYSTNSVNIRTQGDLNLHADNNINMFAGKDLNINAQNIQVESEKQTNMFAGTNFAQSVKGNYTNKVEGGMSLASSGEASFAASGATYINGSKVNLNTGSSGLAPAAVKQVPKVKHTETLYDGTVGFVAAPGKLTSIVSRAPAHTPWTDANKGVNVKTNLTAEANFPASPPTAAQAVNKAVAAAPTNPTTPSVISTVPNVGTVATSMDKLSTNALTSQMAVNAATGKTASAVAQTAGTVTSNGTTTAVMGATALTPTQLSAAGYIKPGMETAIDAAVASGKSLNDAIPANAWTGKDGINSLDDYLKSKNAQVSATQTLLDKSKNDLVSKGILNGKESSSSAGPLVLATASAGTGPVMDYLNKVAGSTTKALSGAVTGALSAKLPPGMMNAVSGSIDNLLSSGKLASGLADKAMGGLAAPSATPEDVSKDLFNKIKESFKPLTSGVPISLEATNAANNAASAASNLVPPDVTAAAGAAASAASKTTNASGGLSDVTGMISKAFNTATASVSSAVSGITDKAKSLFSSSSSQVASGVSSLPGGAESVSSVVNNNVPTSVPGLGSIKDSLSKVSGAASGAMSSVNEIATGLKAKMGSGTSLASFATAGLNPNDMAKLSGAINSVGAGGAAEVQLPTVAEGTNDVAALADQSKALLGNPKIPPIKI